MQDRVLFRIDTFGLTANNVTYAVVGDLMGYWRFFPTADDPWGRVPVWGFADVEASSHADVAEGERYFGYWPMSSHVLLEPVGVGPHGFTDGAAHRADLSPIYNRYQRAAPADADAEGAPIDPPAAVRDVVPARRLARRRGDVRRRRRGRVERVEQDGARSGPPVVATASRPG